MHSSPKPQLLFSLFLALLPASAMAQNHELPATSTSQQLRDRQPKIDHPKAWSFTEDDYEKAEREFEKKLGPKKPPTPTEMRCRLPQNDADYRFCEREIQSKLCYSKDERQIAIKEFQQAYYRANVAKSLRAEGRARDAEVLERSAREGFPFHWTCERRARDLAPLNSESKVR